MAIAGPSTQGFTPDLTALLVQTQVGPLFMAYLADDLGIQDVFGPGIISL